MPGVGEGLWPPGLLAKLLFPVFAGQIMLLHYVGRVDFLRRLVQVIIGINCIAKGKSKPFLKYPLHMFAAKRRNELLFMAKCTALHAARKVKAGAMFEDIPVITLGGETRSLSSYLQGKPLVLNFGSLS
ncbi:hypothetical protein ElyMa_006705200 [Elysia marginata]|uniref:Iodothyronine deiodinase n=1 Tax=Elysia marginata TaxID=1093978 RepID=A0AAV4IRB7_9GAST|nr:hypothetical protein ElyMa_006705200 [Elysia marginata]